MLQRILFLSFLLMGVAYAKKDKIEKKFLKPLAATKSHKIDLEKSKIGWEGAKPGGKHTGQLKFKSGSLQVKGTALVSATFVADMASITNDDLSGAMQKKLVGHLNSPDFFDTAKYPEATFAFTSIKPTLRAGSYKFKGDLTIVGEKVPIDFVADVKEGSPLKAVANFKIDRTKWGLKYKSKNWVKNIGDKFVNDDIKLSISIETESPLAVSKKNTSKKPSVRPAGKSSVTK